jgi:hypothetical protein
VDEWKKFFIFIVVAVCGMGEGLRQNRNVVGNRMCVAITII